MARRTMEVRSSTPQTGPKGERAKAALLAAARSVFSKQGYTHARVQDITNTANFSLGAFYRYFKDKEDILTTLIAIYFEESYATTFLGVRYDPANPTRSLYRSTAQAIAYAAQNSDLMKILWETSQTSTEIEERWNGLRDQLHKRIARLIERAQQDKIGYLDINPVSTAELLIGMTEHAVYRRLVRPGSFAADEPTSLSIRLTELWAHTIFLPEVSRRVDDADL